MRVVRETPAGTTGLTVVGAPGVRWPRLDDRRHYRRAACAVLAGLAAQAAIVWATALDAQRALPAAAEPMTVELVPLPPPAPPKPPQPAAPQHPAAPAIPVFRPTPKDDEALAVAAPEPPPPVVQPTPKDDEALAASAPSPPPPVLRETPKDNEAPAQSPAPPRAPRPTRVRPTRARVRPRTPVLPASARPAPAASPAALPIAPPSAEPSAARAEPDAGALQTLQGRIRAAVQAAVRYPMAAQMMSLTGRARIGFAYRDGGVDGIRLLRSAGDPLLDDAALAAVRKAQYPPPPAGLAGRALQEAIWVELSAG